MLSRTDEGEPHTSHDRVYDVPLRQIAILVINDSIRRRRYSLFTNEESGLDVLELGEEDWQVVQA